MRSNYIIETQSCQRSLSRFFGFLAAKSPESSTSFSGERSVGDELELGEALAQRPDRLSDPLFVFDERKAHETVSPGPEPDTG